MSGHPTDPDDPGAWGPEASHDHHAASAPDSPAGNHHHPPASGMTTPNEAALTSKAQLRLRALVGMVGNVLEWADFAVFGYFSEEIGEAFFPSSSKSAEVMKTFAVFAAAFVMRPLGGVLFGYIGDMRGRKPALLLSIALMSFATFGVACLPTYAMVGALAPVLLIFMRCLQGVSVGGQLVGSFLFTVEAAPQDERGFYGSLTLASSIGGTMLGSVASGILHAALSPEALGAWGWRIPFWCGICVGPLGYWVKDKIKEEAPPHAPLHLHPQHRHPGGKRRQSELDAGATVDSVCEDGGGGGCLAGCMEHPVVQSLFQHPLPILATVAATSIWTTNNYTCLIWLPTYEQSLRLGAGEGPNAAAATDFGYLLATVAQLYLVVAFPVMGWLSDRGGRLRVMLAGASMLIAAGPLLVLALPGASRGAIWLAMLFFVVALSSYGAPFPAWMVEAFPKEMRYTAVGLGYNIAQAAFGGTAPLVATSLTRLAPETLAWVACYLGGLTSVFTGIMALHICGWDPCCCCRSRRRYQRYSHDLEAEPPSAAAEP